MPSLDEAYGRARAGDRDPRRVLAGMATFAAGAVAIVAAILLVTTPLSGLFGLDSVGAFRVAGVIAGLGVPATFLGVVAVLPAARRQRAGVLVGAAIAVVGVALFWHAYPARWTASSDSLAFQTALVYFLGGCLALGFVFVALANAHVRNNPHGTVRLRLTHQGETRTVEVSHEEYERYTRAISDGGADATVVQELEQKARR